MCGICGVVNVAPHGEVDRLLLQRMRDTMAHRGPDDEGLMIAGNIGFGHRRLSIIDLSGGRQPMANDDATVWVVYNGEIYNFREVRADLEARGFAFRTKSDTEVIIRSYEAWGESCVERFRGMFAFAIWDSRRTQLLLARDRVGIKPLYYTLSNGRLLFASEIKAILQWPGVERAMDPIALGHYLRLRYVPGPRTMFRGIVKLQPGHLLILRDGKATVRQYWDVPLEAEPIPEADAVDRFRALLEECVRIHLVSDVPLGTFLSGGIDSTTITSLMAAMVPDTIRTFSIGYPVGAGKDEREFARIAATQLRTIHREFLLEPDRFWDFLPHLVWFMDEPVADPAAVPLYFLSRFARESVTVALSGEGADEILAGYGIYAKMLGLERFRRLPGLSRLRPFVSGRKLSRYLGWATQPLEDCYRGVSAVFGDGEGERLLSPGLTANDDTDFAASYFQRTKGLDPLRRMLYLDLKVWLPDDLLVKADRMTMATSLELRVPFLDHELVEWTWRLPSQLKLTGGKGKHLLRKAMSGIVPNVILDRPKQGFFIPVRQWFQRRLGDAARQLLLEESQGSLFDLREVGRLIARHDRGDEDLSDALFSLVVLAYWHRIFIVSPVVEPPSGLETVNARR